MQCYRCKREYNGPAIRERQRLIESFLPQPVSAAAIEICESPNNPEKVAVLERYFREKLFSDSEFPRTYRQFREQYYAIKILCLGCGHELYDPGLSNVEHSVHSVLLEAEYEYLIQKLNGKCGRDIQPILELVGEKRSVFDFALRSLGEMLGNEKAFIADRHALIEQFRDQGGRGGGFEWTGFAVLRDYLTNEFVKNAIYDIVKTSGVFILGWIAGKIRKNRITASAAKKLREIGTTAPQLYEDDLTRAFRYLTKREKAQLAQKIASRISREKLRDIKKLLK
jgi:hypothetical protein